ncbi:endoplasmic reticulum aminopeptidase 1-like [Acipenser ruthenus]|uniref:endoplasmic reticulum aminopeptidase 1-like n=1 Tax=Acipenser ruthenus TaxID=7906 RepID=UPI00274057BB|nr:endoplasmic reticulum aminopeptidase 1-like [Acipenser ruthenus]XP_058842440.1 endoplasmic reticulum aminopeptidase 1-like [Acipenser ruthenus]XP_058842445.1 endoplasmic reticulum aminopeptidase 1-like [Acipenser ruthenus]
MQSRLRGTSLRRHLLAAALLVALTAQCSASAGQGEESSSETISLLATNGQPFPWNKMRLPSSVSPLHYDLLIHPNLTTLDFTGSVKITVEVKEDTGFVVLHSKHLQISKAVIQQGGGGTSPLQVLEYPAYEQVALLSATPLVTNRLYVISIEYAANLSESFHGFYKSTYRTQEGEVRVLASTQFEPTAARLAFPCFDEPAFKANFSIKIRREAKHIALSNMPLVKSEALGGGLLEDHFDMSVKMSTYLVAFIVSDFVSVSKMSDNGVKISVYAVPEKIDQAHFALEAAAKLLDFYEDYFKIPYPLPKQDLAAIPDFQSGAMENWGLTTYRESALLFNPKTSSASEKLGITMIIAHELAHQWFGNLVTMEWWNDLWLNEGFAKFMEYVSVNITNPELQVEDYFLGQCFNAMEVDALSSSHPISTPVQNPAQIQEMFDDVSYAKGACILNMLRDFLTADAFKIGIIRYLRRYSYENTRNEHLWESLTNICQSDDLDEGRLQGDGFCAGNQQLSATAKWYMHDELDVKTMMNTWTLQQGFPLISVSVRGREVRLSQERYLKGSDPSQSSQYLWHVPLTYITSNSNTVHRFLLKAKNDVLFLPEEVEWIKFNVGMNGYYIVHYEGEGWDALINLLQKNHTALSSNDRASLLNNAFQLVSIGKLPLDKALDLTLYLKHETEIMPVTQGLRELVPLYKLMEKRDMSDVENKMKGYIVQLFRELIDRQTWSDEGSVSQRMLRSYLLMFACMRGYQPCVDKAERLFQEWKESNGNLSLPSDVVLAVYSVGAQTPEGWDFLFEQYRRSLFSAVKSQIKSALTISRMPHKLQWIMEQSLQGDTLKMQDLPYVVVHVSKNPAGHKHAWEFLKTNWHTLVKKFDLGSRSIAHMVTGVTNQYSTWEMLEEVRGFFEALEESGSQLRCVQQAVESIEENIRWMDKNLDKVKGWLQRNHL